MSRAQLVGPLACICMAACGSPRGDDAPIPLQSTGDDVDEGAPGATDTGGADVTGASADGSAPASSEGTQLLLDVAGPDSGAPACQGTADACGCTAVDILFVIDNSGSMYVHQQRLAEVFPVFVDVMIEALPPGTDLHVGITTQGGFWSGTGSGSWDFACVSDASPYPGGYMPPSAGMHGGNGDQGRLYEHAGMRYFAMHTDDDPSALSQWFAAAATLPQADSPQQDQIELLAAAGAYPFHPANADANAGFLRDAGAVLLIFFLTDTSDITPESADDLTSIVRTAKSECGGDDCILTAGMVNPDAFCLAEYPRLGEFMDGFGKPAIAVGDILGGGAAWPPR